MPNTNVEEHELFKELPAWAQFYTKNRWWLKWILLAVAPFFLGVLIGIFSIGLLLGILLGIGAVTVSLMWGLRKVPANPVPNVAILQFLEIRLPIAIGEGYTFTVPVLEELIFIEAQQIERDFVFTNVPCRLNSIQENRDVSISDHLFKGDSRMSDIRPGGGSVSVTIQAVISPNRRNPWALIQLLNRGGVKKALEFLEEVVGEDVRQAGRLLTWYEYMFATDHLSAKLIKDVTGADRVPGEESIHQDSSDEAIREFLEHARKNGISDIKGSGFVIRGLNVSKVDPEGELEKEIARIAKERLKSGQLEENINALRSAMEKLKGDNPDGSLTDADVLSAAQAEDGTVKREFREIKITDAPEIATALAHAISSNRNGGGA